MLFSTTWSDFKILDDIYTSNDFLYIRFNWNNNSREFCERDIETVEHIFLVQEFWLSLQIWLHQKYTVLLPLLTVMWKLGYL